MCINDQNVSSDKCQVFPIKEKYKVKQQEIIKLYVRIMSRTRFGVNPRNIVAWMSRNSLLEAGAKSEV